MNTTMLIPIEKLFLNVATFHNVTFEPALINIFYGNNGTGKTTIARQINPENTKFGQPTDITWRQGKSSKDYSIFVFGQEFIDANFKE